MKLWEHEHLTSHTPHTEVVGKETCTVERVNALVLSTGALFRLFAVATPTLSTSACGNTFHLVIVSRDLSDKIHHLINFLPSRLHTDQIHTEGQTRPTLDW